MIGGIVLAAGSSRRFGEDKRLAGLASGRTILEESIHNASLVLSQLVVVLRFGDIQLAEKLSQTLDDTDKKKTHIECYCAPDSAKGMAHSLANTIHHVKDWQAAIVLLGDMPYIQAETIQTLVDTYKNNERIEPIVVPMRDGRQGHPVVFHRAYFSEIEALEGDTGAKPVIEKHPDKIITVEIEDPGIFTDIDLPEDLAAAKSH